MHCLVQHQQKALDALWETCVASLAGWLTQKLLTKVTLTAHVNRNTSYGENPHNPSYTLSVCCTS